MTPVCARVSLILTLPMGKGAFVQESIFKNGELLFPPITIVHQASYGLKRNFKIVVGIGALISVYV